MPLIAGVALEDGQTALLQADGDALTGPHVVELHLDVGPETEGGHYGAETRFAIDMRRYALPRFVFVDDRLIESLKWLSGLKPLVRLYESDCAPIGSVTLGPTTGGRR